MFALGAFDLLALFFLNQEPATKGLIIGHIAASLVLMVAGWGLVLSRRWAWMLTMLVALASIGFGIYVATLPGDITQLATLFIAIYILIAPGCLLLIALLQPRVRAWRCG